MNILIKDFLKTICVVFPVFQKSKKQFYHDFETSVNAYAEQSFSCSIEDLTIYLFCHRYSRLSITFVSVFLHNPNRRYLFSTPVLFVNHANGTDNFIFSNDEIIRRPQLLISLHDLFKALGSQTHFIVLILFQKI